MAAEAAAYDSWGPRYAPSDPTLPQPWTALIDGCTGLVYYWNLETNATQYQKPVSQMFSAPAQRMPPQQGGYNTPQSYQGVSMEQSQGYQFTPCYTGYQQWSQEYSRKQDVVIQKPPMRYGGPVLNTQQPSPFSQLQYGPKLQKQMPNVSSAGLKTGLNDGTPFNAKNGGIALVPDQPKFPTPMPKVHGKINSGNPTVVASPDALTQSSVDSRTKKHDVTTTGDKVPAPFMSFESAGFPPEILEHIQAAGFALPTPIQAQTWPIALQNRDLVALSKTDSGKTLAYLIPALMLLRRCNNNREHGPTVVVLSPTRELALQIQHEAIKFGRSVKISSLCLYSEGPKGPQLKDLERGADIVVATPGRLNEAIELRKLDFGQVSLLVLDETDKMLDMGFEPQIRKIVNEIPPRKQTLMYAATWRREVRNIAGDLLVNPVQVNIDNANELAANKSSTQDCKHASTDVTKVDGAANQPVPHNAREIATRGGGLRNDRFAGRGGFSGVGSGGPDSGRNRNDRLKDSCGRGQFDNRRDGERRRGRSYSRSRSPSWSRSRSRTPVRRGRSRSRSYSCSRGWSPSPRRGRSRTRRPVRRERRSSDMSLSRSWSRGRSRSRSRSWSRSYSRSRSWSRTVRRERWRESK